MPKTLFIAIASIGILASPLCARADDPFASRIEQKMVERHQTDQSSGKLSKKSSQRSGASTSKAAGHASTAPAHPAQPSKKKHHRVRH